MLTLTLKPEYLVLLIPKTSTVLFFLLVTGYLNPKLTTLNINTWSFDNL